MYLIRILWISLQFGVISTSVAQVPTDNSLGVQLDAGSPSGNPQGSLPQDEVSEKITAVEEAQSAKSVGAEIAYSEIITPSIIPFDPENSILKPYYDFKLEKSEKYRLNFSSDYSILLQQASWTESGNRTGLSQVFRIYGTWPRFGDIDGTSGTLVWKTEIRTALGDNLTPRQLGFDTGSALSTTGYNDFGWGVTNLYWRQTFKAERFGFVAGHIDPSDWADQYAFLNPWRYFLSDAFFTNPAEAVPNNGLGIVGHAFITGGMYVNAGVMDANGQGEEIDLSSFRSIRERFNWIEVGFRGERDIKSRENTHLHYWQQDARKEAGTTESWGLAFTHSRVLLRGLGGVIRAGYSEGNAAKFRRFVGIGVTSKVIGRDVVGLGAGWGSPPDKSLRDQLTSELFYRIQVTRQLAITPDIQLTYKPSFNVVKDWIVIAGIRVRIVF
jgi:porin